jgi:voltage-gated sodium channel
MKCLSILTPLSSLLITQGVKSVFYIVVLLFLVIYIFAILGCILFGENDPAHFGGIGISMVSLFQVSTLASWTSIAYVSWFGCRDYLQSPFDQSNPTTIHTSAGEFQGFQCE